MRERVLWARLYCASRGETEKALKSALLPLFERALGTNGGRLALDALLSEQVRQGNVTETRGSRASRYALSDAGLALAQRTFPHSAGKPWGTVSKTELVAYALGIHKGLRSEAIASLSRAGVLRLAIVGRHLSLDLPAVPTPAEFEQALVWSALKQGLKDSVFEWGKRRSPTLSTIVGALAASLGDVTPSPKKDEVYTRIAAKAVSANNAKDLHAALWVRLIRREGADADGGSATTPSEEPLSDFAVKVLAAARRSQTGKLDASLILINHAFDQFNCDYPETTNSLESFKEHLWASAVKGFLKLASADMPQVLDRRDYANSRIDRGASVFTLIRI